LNERKPKSQEVAVRNIGDRIHWSSMALVLATAFCFSDVHAQALVHFDLPAQPLAQSLDAIGAATNTDVGFRSSQSQGSRPRH
jgi:hypothetical protein